MSDRTDIRVSGGKNRGAWQPRSLNLQRPQQTRQLAPTQRERWIARLQEKGAFLRERAAALVRPTSEVVIVRRPPSVSPHIRPPTVLTAHSRGKSLDSVPQTGNPAHMLRQATPALQEHGWQRWEQNGKVAGYEPALLFTKGKDETPTSDDAATVRPTGRLLRSPRFPPCRHDAFCAAWRQ